MSCALESALIDRAAAFHGHSCPGLSIGIRAAELALERLGTPPGAELVTVVETDMCGVDAIQALTGCTFGKGNLIHRDHGKMAFTFFDRRSGKGFRAVLRPEMQGEIDADLRALMKKLTRGEADGEERRRCEQLRLAAQERFMAASLEEMFAVRPVGTEPPRPPRVLDSLPCEHCGEMAMESRTRRFDGRTLCIACFDRVEQKM